MSVEAPSPAESLAREAAQHLADALALVSSPRAPERRQRLRELLDQAIDRAESACAASEGKAKNRSLLVLARSQAARAEDALHGVGQLSLSAQRAPTREDCDEGWLHAGTIAAVADASARGASEAALAMGDQASSPARAAVARADSAARAARRLLDDRNHAYTFHTDYGFSFGEGWYLAAAAVLAGVAIQIEPDKPATAQADRFLRDAGLGDRLQPFRPRPRANKQTTDIVARAFRADPHGAQQQLRTAFLAQAPIAESVRDWIDRRIAAFADRKKVLVWIRDGAHHAGRNTVASELLELTERVQRAGMTPILLGDALRDEPVPTGCIDMILFWKEAIFRGADARRAQLQFFEHLRELGGVVGQLGVTTAGMDGPALLGMPTMYLTETSNVRMRAWVGAVPGYREIVRESGYLDRVSSGLKAWANDGVTASASTTSRGPYR